MNVRYRILFNIEVLHDYYNNLRCTDLTFRPSADTADRLRAGQMLYKTLGNRLIVLVKVSDDDKPYITPDEFLKLRFFIELQHHNFVTISSLNQDYLRNRRLYFTNLAENKIGTTLYLSSSISAHDATNAYHIGDMASSGGHAFECIKTPTGSNGTDKPLYWYDRGAVQYVTPADMIELSSGVKNFSFNTPADLFDIQVYGLNTTNNEYDEEVMHEVRTTGHPVKDVQVDMRHLPPGKYKIKINAETYEHYIDAEAVYGNVLGIVDLFNHLDGTNEFALLDDLGATKEHTYTIHFANRLAIWKYLTTKQGVKNVNDTTHTYTFIQKPDAPATAEYFESNQPIPLKQTPRVFELELNAPLGEPPPAPNPNPNDGGMLTRNGDQYVCKIYLNY
jgi:hypothetical protein